MSSDARDSLPVGSELLPEGREAREVEELLDYLARSRNFDFSGYKRPSLARRIGTRMALLRVESFTDYLDYLQVHPEEFQALFNAILINVTSFFRDPAVWAYVAGEVVPRILAAKGHGEPVRVWSAGCASGEEAATLAIILAEALGIEAFRERVKVYATDVDEDELARARSAEYSPRAVQAVPEEYRAKYFEPVNGNFCLHRDLRRAIIYGRHDLLQDAPISRVDLLACRNTLMYFNAEAQAAILARFNFALRDSGYLVMGKAEMLLTHQNLFTPVDLRRRVFQKVARPTLRERLIGMVAGANREAAGVNAHLELAAVAFEGNPVAQVVIDTSGSLVLANERARSLFGLNVRDLGRPLQDLELSYRPVELRSHLERVLAEKRVVNLADVAWRVGEESISFDVQLLPLHDAAGAASGVAVSFTDVGPYRRLQDELQGARRELETAYEELQTTNEEFQSAVEELETTNEELQSTNEELETVNEELQSTNEELQAVNQEMQRRSEELNQVNAFLESIFRSMRGGVVVTDRDLRVQVWNHVAEDLWGLRADEVVGQHFLNLDIGLPVDQLRPAIRACLSGDGQHAEQTLPAINRRGRAISCSVDIAPLLGHDDLVRGIIFMMEPVDGADGPAKAAPNILAD